MGHSTLTVSLPREWAVEAGLKAGSIVTISPDPDGALRVLPGVAKNEDNPTKCVIDAELCTEPEMLTRVIIGAFLIGNDTIQVTAKDQLRPEQLDQIRKATERLSGIGVVEQTIRQATLQSFVDPTKFAVEGLVRRLHIIASSMQEAAVKAFLQRNVELADGVLHMEDEADRIYWLIVRQLILCARNRSIASKIGIDNPIHIAGYRVIARDLEVMADCAEVIAHEVLNADGKLPFDQKIGDKVSKYNDLIAEVSENSGRALWTKDLRLANACLERAKIARAEQRKLMGSILREVKDVHAAVALRSIVSNLALIAYYAQTMSEIVMNWIIAESNEIAKSHIPIEEPADLR